MTDPLVTDFYVTVLEADVYLKNKDEWIDAEKTEKEDALLWGRYYIDANFNCGTIDMDALSDEIKFANSLLGYDYLTQGDLFFDNSPRIKLKRVKAGSVETEKEFFSSVKEKPNSLSKIIAILKPVCTYTKGKLTRV